MKSQASQLRSRGFLGDEDVVLSQGKPTEDLVRQVDSEDAVERSAAIRLLAQSAPVGDSVNRIFVDRLTREAKLYTKLELCDALQVGGVETARLLMPLLGTIGKNQHTQPATEAFRKSSYPLPRDIVARILARMDPQILPLLIAVLRDGPRSAIVEVIDAIGFMCFYSAVTPTDRRAALRGLIDAFHGNSHDELMQWKIVRAFESFNHPECILLLRAIESASEAAPLRQEAQRSLAMVITRPAMTSSASVDERG
jgi:hypothetical protein